MAGYVLPSTALGGGAALQLYRGARDATAEARRFRAVQLELQEKAQALQETQFLASQRDAQLRRQLEEKKMNADILARAQELEDRRVSRQQYGLQVQGQLNAQSLNQRMAESNMLRQQAQDKLATEARADQKKQVALAELNNIRLAGGRQASAQEQAQPPLGMALYETVDGGKYIVPNRETVAIADARRKEEGRQAAEAERTAGERPTKEAAAKEKAINTQLLRFNAERDDIERRRVNILKARATVEEDMRKRLGAGTDKTEVLRAVNRVTRPYDNELNALNKRLADLDVLNQDLLDQFGGAPGAAPAPAPAGRGDLQGEGYTAPPPIAAAKRLATAPTHQAQPLPRDWYARPAGEAPVPPIRSSVPAPPPEPRIPTTAAQRAGALPGFQAVGSYEDQAKVYIQWYSTPAVWAAIPDSVRGVIARVTEMTDRRTVSPADAPKFAAMLALLHRVAVQLHDQTGG